MDFGKRFRKGRIDTSDNLRQFDVDQVEVTRPGSGCFDQSAQAEIQGHRKYSTVLLYCTSYVNLVLIQKKSKLASE